MRVPGQRDATDATLVLLEQVTNSTVSEATSLINYLNTYLNGILENLINQIISYLNGVTQDCINNLQTILNKVLSSGHDITKCAGIPAIKNILNEVIDKVKSCLQTLLNSLNAAVDTALANIHGVVDLVNDTIDEATNCGLLCDGVMTTVQNLILTVPVRVLKHVISLISAIAGLVKTLLMNCLCEVVRAALQNIASLVRDILACLLKLIGV